MPTWATAIHAELLDCLQANLAPLAERYRESGRYLALGSELRFAPRPGDAGLPTIEPLLTDHLATASQTLGLAVSDRWSVSAGADPATLLRGHEIVYGVADAFYLPWVPYHGHVHMVHSFLLEPAEGGVVVHDAYHNDTPWGQARPVSLSLASPQIPQMLPQGADLVAIAPAGAVGGLPVSRYVAPMRDLTQSYLDAYRQHAERAEALERLTLETWLMVRSRRLHAAFCLSAGSYRDPQITRHLTAWARLAEYTYLAHQRVVRGKPEPGAVTERLAVLLDADAVVFAGPGLRARVAAEVADTLRVPETDLLAGTPLRDFPVFSSFRLVEIVERLEKRIGVQFDADDLVPENLNDLESLCRLVARSPEEPA
jgi:acyl carrier protein